VTKYRILQIDNKYYPQEKWLFFWKYMLDGWGLVHEEYSLPHAKLWLDRNTAKKKRIVHSFP